MATTGNGTAAGKRNQNASGAGPVDGRSVAADGGDSTALAAVAAGGTRGAGTGAENGSGSGQSTCNDAGSAAHGATARETDDGAEERHVEKHVADLEVERMEQAQQEAGIVKRMVQQYPDALRDMLVRADEAARDMDTVADEERNAARTLEEAIARLNHGLSDDAAWRQRQRQRDGSAQAEAGANVVAETTGVSTGQEDAESEEQYAEGLRREQRRVTRLCQLLDALVGFMDVHARSERLVEASKVSISM